MEKITILDLNSAFKALDEIEIPHVEGMKNAQALREAIKLAPKADALVEDYYDVNSKEDLTQAKEEREEEIAAAKLAKIEKIVDLDADSPEDLQPSYVGKTIIQCPQCMTLFYKDANDIEVSEENPDVVNVGEVCQHCGNDSGYSVIGKVAEVEPEEKDKFENTEEKPAEEENELDLNFEEPNTDGIELEEVPVEEESAVESFTHKLADTLTEEFENTLTEAAIDNVIVALQAKPRFENLPASTLKKLVRAYVDDSFEDKKDGDVTVQEFEEWFGENPGEIIFAYGSELKPLEIRKIGLLDPKFIEACKAVEAFNLEHDDTDYKIDDDEVVELAVGDGSEGWIEEIENEYKKLHECNKTITEDPDEQAILDIMNSWGSKPVEHTQEEDKEEKLSSKEQKPIDEVDAIMATWESVNNSEEAKPAEDTENHSENLTLNEEEAPEEDAKEELPEVEFTTEEVKEVATEVAQAVSTSVKDEEEAEEQAEKIAEVVEETVTNAVEEKIEAVEEAEVSEVVEEHIQDRPAAVEDETKLQGGDTAVVDCQTDHKIIAHCEDEKPLDCLMKKPALEEPLAGEEVEIKLNEAENELPKATDAEVEKMLDSAEFKKPISEAEVDAILAGEEKTESLNKSEEAKPEEDTEHHSENLTLNEETTDESLNNSEAQKDAEEKSELKTENESENLTLNEEATDAPMTDEEKARFNQVDINKFPEEEKEKMRAFAKQAAESLNKSEAQEDAAEHSELETENHSEELTLNEDLDSDMDKYNAYVEYLRALLKQDEEALEKAKKLKDNEFAVKVIEKRIAADKEDLEAALPNVVKEKQAEEELPTPEEAQVEAPKEEVQECAKQKTIESLDEIDDKALTECISKSLTNVYENVDSFALTNCELANNNLIIEGKINFKSGLNKDTKYIFTEAVITDDRAELKGCNSGLAENSEFKLCGSINENTLIAESLSYKYNIGEELVEGLASIN